METPKYKVTHWADDLASMEHNGADLGTQIIHTPGHTPDELAVWDAAERTLYVGDTLYEGTAIVFPAQGNLKLYSESIGRLKELVKGWNADTALPRVKIACGHSTSSADAVEILDEVDAYLFEVVKGMVTPYAKENTQDLSGDGEESRWFFKRGGGKIAFGIPKRLIDDFEADTQAMATIEKRQNQ
jgi:glyoxylase-like metal-dependent hydrolase (beta-lactamase superfamily II)